MKKALLMMLVLMFTITSFSQIWIKSEDAINHEGDVVNILGFVSKLSFVSRAQMAGTHIKLLNKDPGKSLTLIVLRKDLLKFEKISNELIYNYVHVKGKVAIRNGKPYIILSSPTQLSIVREAPEIQIFEPL